MLPDQPSRPTEPGTSSCYRHPDRGTGISCTRCGRPICPECMVNAAVGFQCPECAGEARREHRPARTRFGGRLDVADGALVTKLLIGLNVAVFLLTTYLRPSLWETLSLHSATGADAYRWYGVPLYGVSAGSGQWYRMLTAMFVHNGPLHIVMNMISLWVLGPQLERVLGRVRYLALYLVCGLAGNAFAYVVSGGNLWSVGASGAIFGLLGATIVLFRVTRTPLGPVIALLVFNLVITFSVARIDWRAHVGGLIAGVLTAVGLMYAPRARRNPVQAATVLVMLGVVVLAVAVETARLGA